MAYEYFENVLALIAIFLVGYYIQEKQKNNWIVGFINLFCVSFMCFAIENELMFQIMIFFINFINCIGHLFLIYKSKGGGKRE